jgi:hypothetical protein
MPSRLLWEPHALSIYPLFVDVVFVHHQSRQSLVEPLRLMPEKQQKEMRISKSLIALAMIFHAFRSASIRA